MNQASGENRLFSWERLGRGDSGLNKLILLAVIIGLSAVLFLPSLTFFGFKYKPGDVAIMDMKSPVTMTSGDISIKKGEIIVRDGQIVTETDLKKFALIGESLKHRKLLIPMTGFLVFTAVFMAIGYFFAAKNIRKFSTLPKDMLLMAVVFMGVLVLMRFSDIAALMMKELFPAVPTAVYKYLIPVAAGPMLVRLLLNSETALVFTAVTSVIVGFFMGGSLDMAAYTLIGGVTAAMGVRHCTHRSIVIKAGLVVGAVNSLTLVSIALIKGGSTFSEPVFLVFAGVLNGLITAVLAVGIAPVLESAFQYTTNIRLLELSRMDHPLLKELAMRAPGTYHHSIVIGTLVEAAAESIHANPLLARVSAYYHDIGKSKMPQYFIENISDENRHDDLAPSMSALVLTSHVKEGVELARQYRLGSEITDVISQHHGTSLISYFYQKAKTMEEPLGRAVNEEEFRYHGPRPQTKEAGLVMLADAIEAASKTIPDPTPEKIQWLTQKIVNKIFADGQLDECELTLKDLNLITQSFNRVFVGIYHQRISYPEPTRVLQEDRLEGAGHDLSGDENPAGGDKKNGGDRVKRIGMP